MNATDAIEKLNHWEQLADGTLDERAYFCRRVKPLIPELRVLVIEQHGRVVQLIRELTGARADAAEYKTRAESEAKTNATLREQNCVVSAENMRLRTVMEHARGVLVPPEAVSF